jgi:UrcA family protein
MHVLTQIFATTVMLAALCFGAHADTSTDGRPTHITGRRAVYYGDLNLNAEEGAKIMLQRIERAAKKACGGHATFSSYTGSPDRTFEECRVNAILRAVNELGAPLVTRIYSEARPRKF